MTSLKDKITLVTGASRGLGWACALAMAEQGAHIIALARTVGALEELDDAIRAKGGSATLVPLDLTDFEAIDRLGLSLYERWKRLDILVGNAGVLGSITPVPHLTVKEFNSLVNVNITANFRLIRAMDPLLRSAPAGRAIFVTSGAAHKNTPFWGGYAMSKAALESMVLTYAKEMEGTTVKINLLNPGPVRTAMRAKAMPGEDPATLPSPAELAPLFVRLAREDYTENGQIVSFTRAM
jgi:NAD(P)-dependent dehydrogenase (short-subunit alcohol dehydrogenase family)